MYSGGQIASPKQLATPNELTPQRLKQLWEEWKAEDSAERPKSGDANPVIEVNGRKVELFHRSDDGWDAYSRKVYTEGIWWSTVQIQKFGKDYRAYLFSSNGIPRAKASALNKPNKPSYPCKKEQPTGELLFSTLDDSCPTTAKAWDKIWTSRYPFKNDYFNPKYWDEQQAANLYWVELAFEAVSGEDFSLMSETGREARRVRWLGEVVHDTTRDARERINAARQLGDMGASAEAAVFYLCATLGLHILPFFNSYLPSLNFPRTLADSEWVLCAVAEALGKIGRGNDMPPGLVASSLMLLIPTRSERYEESARHALTQIVRNLWNGTKEENFRITITSALRNKDVRLRRFVTKVLADSGIAGVHPLLIEASHDSDPEIQQVAREALSKLWGAKTP